MSNRNRSRLSPLPAAGSAPDVNSARKSGQPSKTIGKPQENHRKMVVLMGFNGVYQDIWWLVPSGELSHSNGKIHLFLMGKFHYFDWAIFNCFLYVHQRVNQTDFHGFSWEDRNIHYQWRSIAGKIHSDLLESMIFWSMIPMGHPLEIRGICREYCCFFFWGGNILSYHYHITILYDTTILPLMTRSYHTIWCYHIRDAYLIIHEPETVVSFHCEIVYTVYTPG